MQLDPGAIVLDGDDDDVVLPGAATAVPARTAPIPVEKIQAAAVPKDRASYRLPMFDAMRVVAAFAVIWTHTPEHGTWVRYANASRFGTAFFTVAALILVIRSLDRRPDQTFTDYATTRAKRLMIPLVLWSAIYAVFHVVLSKALHSPPWIEWSPGLLLGGASTHLWFLPYILIACVAGFPILKWAHTHPEVRAWLVPVLAVLGLIFLFVEIPTEFGDRGTRTFLHHLVWSLPTFFWGVGIAVVYPKKLSDRLAAMIAVTGVLLFIVAFRASLQGVNSPVIQAVKGVAAAMIALSHWSPKFVQVLAKYGTLSFGVYLVHMFFVLLYREVGEKFVSPMHVWFYPAVTVLAFISAYTLAVLCNRSKVGKVLFP